jgi:hypothetical protein
MSTDDRELSGDLIQAVEQLSEAFAQNSIRYALIGGIAATMRGRPRFTQDVDVLLDVPQLALPALLENLANRGFLLDIPTVIREYVREHLTMIRYGSIRVDWLKPVLPLYVRTLVDANELPWTPGHSLRVATPEGLILTKLVAFREQDQADIVAMLAANRSAIDVALIRREWQPLADLERDRTAWLETAISRILGESSSTQ